jgi:hypothetical protein
MRTTFSANKSLSSGMRAPMPKGIGAAISADDGIKAVGPKAGMKPKIARPMAPSGPRGLK